MIRSTIATGAVLVAALAASCAQAPVRGPAAIPSGAQPWRSHYEALRSQGQRLLDVDPARSLVVIEVRRGGKLAALGHDHVVASHELTGFIAPDAGVAEVSIPLSTLTVDEPELRRAAGFPGQLSPSDIQNTRVNMLNHVLDPRRHPFVAVSVSQVPARSGPATVEAELMLNGVTRPEKAEITIEPGTERMHVGGRMSIRQTDFGLVPYAILAGGIRVEDELVIRFDVVAGAAPKSR